jgi:diacylglycerol kinase (ATP)
MQKSPMHTLYIINPTSGNVLAKQKKEIAQRIISKYFPNDKVICTEYTGHATEICEKYRDKVWSIVAVGGDGTVHEIATALQWTDTPMGIIPAGSGNGFSYALHIPSNVTKAVRTIKQWHTKTIDLLRVNDTICNNISGIGFDAHIAEKFPTMPRRWLLSYIKLMMREFAAYSPQKYTIQIDEKEPVELETFLLTIANGTQRWNGAQIAPYADFADGKLDITHMSAKPTVMSILFFVARLYTKSVQKHPHIDYQQAKKILITTDSGSIQAHIDGEPKQLEKLDIQILPNALTVIVPRPYKQKPKEHML